MKEYLKCTRCRALLWDEVDRIGRVYFVHPDTPCIEPEPEYWHECSVCGADVRLSRPYRGRQIVVCGSNCRAVYERQLRLRDALYNARSRRKRRRNTNALNNLSINLWSCLDGLAEDVA